MGLSRALGPAGPHCMGVLEAGHRMFGALHLIAWDFAFPSEETRTLWRVLSLVITVFPVVVLVAYKVSNWLFDAFPSLAAMRKAGGVLLMVSGVVSGVLFWLVMGIFFCFFPLIRIGLLVEAFWSTYYLPPSAYLSTWANEMPYVG